MSNNSRIENVAASPGKTTEILDDLWRRRLDTLISGIANGDPYYQQIANAAEHISAEYQGRFLIELIQNANDQAVRQGLSNSLVSITRTNRSIAVGNSGQPFDRTKVDAITSLFKSDKTADECIGNKGIGFKAVFQITDSAEVFSCGFDSNLAEGCATAFRMVRRPFDNPSFLEQIRALAEDLLRRYPDRWRAVEERYPGEDPVDVTLRESQRAAWFTFPLAMDECQFKQRAADLNLNHDLLSSTQTLIVLPLDESEQTCDRLNSAIDEIQGGDVGSEHLPPAASFLFLPGISTIEVTDQVRGFRSVLEKRETSTKEPLSDGISLRHMRTTQTLYDLHQSELSGVTKSQDWWVVDRMLGADDDASDSSRAEKERCAIRESIRALHLPEENWKDVDQVPVAVALPVPSRGDTNDVRPLGARGRFCIGLPTQVETGVPLWVSAHFHGKIDRTSIEFENDYNRLLFSAAVDLSTAMLERLKGESQVATRRLVTLAMERGIGPLSDAFYERVRVARTTAIFRVACDDVLETRT